MSNLMWPGNYNGFLLIDKDQKPTWVYFYIFDYLTE